MMLVPHTQGVLRADFLPIAWRELVHVRNTDLIEEESLPEAFIRLRGNLKNMKGYRLKLSQSGRCGKFLANVLSMQ